VLEVIDRLADDPRRPHLERIGGEDRDGAQEERDAVALQVRKKMS